MKKTFLLCLLLMVTLTVTAFAADTARRGSFSSGLEGVMGLGDVSSGNCVEVDDNGSLQAAPKSRGIATHTFTSTTLGTGHALISGTAYLQALHIMGATAGDWVAVYDGTSTEGTVRFEPRLAANTSSLIYDTKGGKLTNGTFVESNAAGTIITAVYDY